jgi:hypothetical protein
MDWFELAIRYSGIALLSVVAMALIAGTLLCIAIVVIRLTPRLHFGKPQNDGELHFYDPCVIITGKGDKRIEGERRLITDPLKIKWWVGLSKRNSSKWFIGLIRWEPKSE